MTAEQMTRIEREMEGLQHQFKTVEAAYGDDVLHLVIASGYLSKLLRNERIEQHLNRFHPELIAEFRAIISAVSLDEPDEEQGIACSESSDATPHHGETEQQQGNASVIRRAILTP